MDRNPPPGWRKNSVGLKAGLSSLLKNCVRLAVLPSVGHSSARSTRRLLALGNGTGDASMTFNAAVKIEVAADPMAAVRAVNRMTQAGFALALEEGRLMVEPLSRLNEQQRAYIRAHKAALVALLLDAEVVYRAVEQAGPAGLWWREGTPAEWSDARLLAAGEVLYADGRMVNRNDRRYLRAHAPPIPDVVTDSVPDSVPDIPADTGQVKDSAESVVEEVAS